MIATTYLRKVGWSDRDQAIVLKQSTITDIRFNADWSEFVDDFLKLAVYPKPSSNKFECYGWTPTLFEEGVNKYGQHGHWRLAAYGGDELSLFVADMDNQFAEREMIPIDALEAFLGSLGLSFMLYTSWTHKPDRHKVRIVVPVTRYLTPDEAFKVFTWFNHALDYQLDGSIYDQADYLYGPPMESDIRVERSGQPLDVDHYLPLADQLPEEAKTFVKRGAGTNGASLTPEQFAHALKMASIQEPSRDDVSMDNPAIFKPEWKELLANLYQGGSRSRTIRGLLAKTWVRSGSSLTKGDLWTLFREMDATFGGHCLKTYGFGECDRTIASAMEAVGTPRIPEDDPAHNERLMKRFGIKKD